MNVQYILWGVTASPYQLKMQALLDYTGCSWQRWPQQAGRVAAMRTAWRLQRAKQRGAVRRFPAMATGLDEYPSVPFYTRDGRDFFYDSSSLARHLDHESDTSDSRLLPDSGLESFLCHLIDEAFDEFGLYMVHHMRWVGSARTTPMGERTAGEYASLLPPGAGSVMARQLPRRQVRRCPYLFSVAPAGYECGVAPALTPPARVGFPATHELLDEAWRAYLAAMEHVLERQPYLLGGRFTLADASAYGQFGMNLVDGDATRLMAELAPHTFAWLRRIESGEHLTQAGEVYASDSLQPLLEIIGRTFLPLMAQNESAYDKALTGGETLFNEAAFDQGRSLYDGELLGQPFRSVAKSFQVVVWRALKSHWADLAPAVQAQLRQSFLFESAHLLD
ncbi:MAG: glutathione S-transferase [Bacteroidia bacterium]|jgi:glutathione S-transferase